MGQKNITYSEAGAIAGQIASKAFEHLIPPLEEKLQVELQHVYETMLNRLDLNISAMVTHKLAEMQSYVWIEFVDSDGEEHRLMLGEAYRYRDGVDQPRPYAFEQMLVTDQDLTFNVSHFNQQLIPLVEKRRLMVIEVREQMMGKSAATVCNNWPEVAGFVRDYFKISKVSDMTVPFESLVAKYLLALPAPEPV